MIWLIDSQRGAVGCPLNFRDCPCALVIAALFKVGFCVVGFVRLANVLQCAVAH